MAISAFHDDEVDEEVFGSGPRADTEDDDDGGDEGRDDEGDDDEGDNDDEGDDDDEGDGDDDTAARPSRSPRAPVKLRSRFVYLRLFNVSPQAPIHIRHISLHAEILRKALLPSLRTCGHAGAAEMAAAIRDNSTLHVLDAVFDLDLPKSGDTRGDSVQTDGDDLCVLYDRGPKPGPSSAASTACGSGAAAEHDEGRPGFGRRYDPPPPHCGRAGSARRACGGGGGGGFDPFRRVIGVDPGRVALVTAAEVLPFLDAHGRQRVRVWTLSRKRWRSDINAARREATARKWTTELRRPPDPSKPGDLGGAFVQLADPDASGKTADVAQYVKHVRVHLLVREDVFDETRKPRWANARFTAWQAKQRALSRFWGEVAAGKLEDGTAGVRPMIAYGDAQFASSYRGGLSAPTTAAYVACINVLGAASVCLTSEYRSTKTHAACGCVLRKVVTEVPSQRHVADVERWAADKADWDRAVDQARELGRPYPPPFRRHKPHDVRGVGGLRVCANPECPERGRSFVNRDVNAALNIRLAFLRRDKGLPPPEHLDPDHAADYKGGWDEDDRRLGGLYGPFRIRAPEVGSRKEAEHGVPHGDGLRARLRRERAGRRPRDRGGGAGGRAGGGGGGARGGGGGGGGGGGARGILRRTSPVQWRRSVVGVYRPGWG
jgi:uncharacterized membrane protein YgcG